MGMAASQTRLWGWRHRSAATASLSAATLSCWCASANLVLYGRAVDAHTLFAVASVSKLFTGIVALRAWEEGRLDLDADVGETLGFALSKRAPGFWRRWRGLPPPAHVSSSPTSTCKPPRPPLPLWAATH